MAIGIRQIQMGQTGPGLLNIAKGATIVEPIAEYLWRGNTMGKYWNGTAQPPDATMQAVMQAEVAGGARWKQGAIYKTGAWDKMLEGFRSDKPLQQVLAARHIPFAALEKLAWPVLDWAVPRVKQGAFYDIARAELAKNPNASPAEVRRWAAKAWDSVDNRLGQVVYDNVFLNQTAKDAAFIMVRAPGFTGGSLREFSGGAWDAGKMAVNAVRGKPVELTNRTAYTFMGLPLATAWIGGLTCYLLTGKGPTQLKDYFFPPTGEKDKDGNDVRIAVHPYVGDAYHWATQSVQTAANKLHPLLSQIHEQWANKDYYGTKIANEDDPWSKRIADRLEHAAGAFEPLAARNTIRNIQNNEPPAKALMPLMGIPNAPRDMSETPAMRTAREVVENQGERGTRTQEEADKSKLKAKLSDAYAKSGDDAPLIKALRVDHTITESEYTHIIKTAKLTSLERAVHLFAQHPLSALDHSLKVWDDANASEREKVKPIIDGYWRSYQKAHSELSEQTNMRQQLQKRGLL
jgi:hypothetical protein